MGISGVCIGKCAFGMVSVSLGECGCSMGCGEFVKWIVGSVFDYRG